MSEVVNASFGGVSSYSDLSGNSFLPDSGQPLDKRAIGLNSLKVASTVASSIPGAGPAGSVISMVGRAIGGGLNAYDAQNTVAELKAIAVSLNGSSLSASDKSKLQGCLDHLLAKQGIKFKAGVSNATVIGQPGETIYRAGKAIYKFAKGTKGVHRQESAQALIDMLKSPNADAKGFAERILMAVAKNDFDKMIKATIANVFKS